MLSLMSGHTEWARRLPPALKFPGHIHLEAEDPMLIPVPILKASKAVFQGTPISASVDILCAEKRCIKPEANSNESALFPDAQIVAEASTV